MLLSQLNLARALAGCHTGGHYEVITIARGPAVSALWSSSPRCLWRHTARSGDLVNGRAKPRAHRRDAAGRRHEIRLPTARPSQDGRRRRRSAIARARRLGRVQTPDGAAMVMGDLVLTEHEIAPVMSALQQG